MLFAMPSRRSQRHRHCPLVKVSCRPARSSDNGKTIASNSSRRSPSIQSYIFHLTLKTYM